MSELKSQLQDADPLADARAWLAHMEQTLVRLAAERALSGTASVNAVEADIQRAAVARPGSSPGRLSPENALISTQ